MNIGAIITATVVVAAVGLFIGIFLSVAGKKFAVETDEREVAVREALPGNNCGGCGYPGCDGLAAAIAKGDAPVNACRQSDRRNHGTGSCRIHPHGCICKMYRYLRKDKRQLHLYRCRRL